MADGNTVTLTFAGESTGAEGAMGRVGSSSRRMADDVGDSSRRAGDSARGGLDRIGDGADGAEGKFQGFSDVISGFSDTATSFAEGDIAGMAAGLASIAGGIASSIVPIFGTLVGAIGTAASATWAFTVALLANPITWIVVGIIALIAVIVLMITHWEEVKAVFTTVMDWIGARLTWVVGVVNGAGAAIGAAFTSAFNWARDRGVEFLAFITGIPGRIGGAFGVIADFISAPFRSAFGFIRNLWNSTVGGFSFSIPSWVPFVGGNSFSMPRMHSGGIVPGNQGSEMMAILQAGERVIPAGGQQGTSGAQVTFSGNTSDALATVFMQLIRQGKIQIS